MTPEADLVREGLRLRGCLEIRATGASMLPLIPPGLPLQVHACRPEDLRVGDVLLCRSAEGWLLVHRFLGWRDGRLVLKGDARWRLDAPLPAEALLGRVSAAGLRWRLGQPLAVALLGWPGALLLRSRASRPARWGARLLPGVLRLGLALRSLRARRASPEEVRELWGEPEEGVLAFRIGDAVVVGRVEDGAVRILGLAGRDPAEVEAVLGALALRTQGLGPWRWRLAHEPAVLELALACGFRSRDGQLEKTC